ncbi:MAG: hypothetical protein JWO03_2867 [Bacteroidetes bacterium]|nr:hypothetical protein [Bacteroidota bacterium]
MMSCTAFSQSSYPRPVVIDGDTLEAVTRPQMRSLIELRYAYDACDTERTVLSREVDSLNVFALRQDTAFASAQGEIQGYDAEVRLLNKRIAGKDEELKVNKDLMRRKTIRAVVGGLTASAATIAVGILIGFFIHR